MSPRRALLLLVLVLAPASLVACGEDENDPNALTVYSGRNEELVGDLMEQFEKASGITVNVRYGDSAELAATLAEEGDSSPADVFFAQDAGALGAVAEEGMLAPLSRSALDVVPERFRDPRGRWVGTSGRARVVAYSTQRLQESDLPDSILDFCDPKWRGRIAFAPPNASFQAFVSALRISLGDAKAREWLQCMKDLDPTLAENNIQSEEAIADGEVDVAFVNHYYLGELKAERPGFPVANHFLSDGDPGTLVNVAGAGILSTSDKPAQARRFVQFLLSPAGQQYFANRTFEYPLVDGVAPPADVKPLADVHGPEIALGDLGAKLRSTLELLQDVGLTT